MEELGYLGKGAREVVVWEMAPPSTFHFAAFLPSITQKTLLKPENNGLYMPVHHFCTILFGWYPTWSTLNDAYGFF